MPSAAQHQCHGVLHIVPVLLDLVVRKGVLAVAVGVVPQPALVNVGADAASHASRVGAHVSREGGAVIADAGAVAAGGDEATRLARRGYGGGRGEPRGGVRIFLVLGGAGADGDAGSL